MQVQPPKPQDCIYNKNNLWYNAPCFVYDGVMRGSMRGIECPRSSSNYTIHSLSTWATRPPAKLGHSGHSRACSCRLYLGAEILNTSSCTSADGCGAEHGSSWWGAIASRRGHKTLRHHQNSGEAGSALLASRAHLFQHKRHHQCDICTGRRCADIRVQNAGGQGRIHAENHRRTGGAKAVGDGNHWSDGLKHTGRSGASHGDLGRYRGPLLPSGYDSTNKARPLLRDHQPFVPAITIGRHCCVCRLRAAAKLPELAGSPGKTVLRRKGDRLSRKACLKSKSSTTYTQSPKIETTFGLPE